jgi:hypothetical protein
VGELYCSSRTVSRRSVSFSQLGGHFVILYRIGLGLCCNDRVGFVHLLHSCFHVDAVSLEVQVGFCVKGHTVPDTMRCLFRKTSVAFLAEYQCDEVISSFETPLRVRPQGCASDYHLVRPCLR